MYTRDAQCITAMKDYHEKGRNTNMKAEGKAHTYGSHVNTDEIIPARYLNTSDANDLAAHCMEDIDKEFVNNVSEGDVIVAQENFGCGSSREHAPLAIKTAGVSCVIAKSFARIFFRNSINIGLPILESREAPDKIDKGDTLSIDFSTGTITNVTKNETYTATAFPEFMQELINEGGLMAYAKKKLALS